MIYMLALLSLALPAKDLGALDATTTAPVTVVLLGTDGKKVTATERYIATPTRWALIKHGDTYLGYYFQAVIRSESDPTPITIGCLLSAPATPAFGRKKQRFVVLTRPVNDGEGVADVMCRKEGRRTRKGMRWRKLFERGWPDRGVLVRVLRLLGFWSWGSSEWRPYEMRAGIGRALPRQRCAAAITARTSADQVRDQVLAQCGKALL